MLRRTIYLDDETAEYVDHQPRTFNLSGFVRKKLKEKINEEKKQE